jgi:hypothetical protein
MTNISDISQYKFYQPKTVENIEYKLQKIHSLAWRHIELTVASKKG